MKRERIKDQQLEAKCILGRVTQVIDGNCERFGLSKREREIALLIAQGKQYKFIADELFISVETVKTHVKNIFKKVEVSDKTELVFNLWILKVIIVKINIYSHYEITSFNRIYLLCCTFYCV